MSRALSTNEAARSAPSGGVPQRDSRTDQLVPLTARELPEGTVAIGMSETALLCSLGPTAVNRTVTAAGGGNYQSLINTALREHMKHKVESLETTLRRVLREELRTAG